MDWIEQAHCRDSDTEVFFGRGERRHRQALALCRGCDVREPCLTYALRNDIDTGIWGGFSELQRRALRRRRVS